MAVRGQSTQTQGQDRSYSKFHGRCAEINGHQVEDHGDKVYMRPLRPNQPPDPDASATTPHPDPEMRADGWRMEWFFFGLLIAICLGIIFKTGMITL